LTLAILVEFPESGLFLVQENERKEKTMDVNDSASTETDASCAVRFVRLLEHAEVSQEDRTISIEFDTADDAFYAIRCLAACENPQKTKEKSK
jgi:hypothetical protein